MDKEVEKLISAKNLLSSSLVKTKSLGLSLEKCCPRLDEINHRLLSVDLAVRPDGIQTHALTSVGAHINRAIVPAAAVLKVFDAIHGLEKSLSDPQSDLPGYLGVLKRLEEALTFLGENCVMAIQWLSDVSKFLEDNKVGDGWFISRLNKELKDLKDENGHFLDGGLLEVALDRLESEFKRLLVVNSVPLPMMSAEQVRIESSPLPVPIIHKLQAILVGLIANGRLENCASIYVEVRSSTAQASLQALNLDYLKMSISEFDSIPSGDFYISQWRKHLEFAIKHLFEAEHKLSNEVFEMTEHNVRRHCFAKISTQAGILEFLQFGKTVTESKNNPMKLLKLLNIFASLNNLRSDFNRLFGGDSCVEVQNLTRDLIKKLIEGTSAVFQELPEQVERERSAAPPPDCGIHKVMAFITDYCNKLLGNKYRPILARVLVIERSWKREKYHEKTLVGEIVNLIKAVELNLESWSKGYKNEVPSYLFLMNNHWHLQKCLKGTKIGYILGDSWLTGHEKSMEYYSTMFVRESWAKLLRFLNRDGLVMFSGGRETARDRVKQSLKGFNEAFDEMYKKQSNWNIPDNDLRERMRANIIQTIVPVYRSYMQYYGALVEKETNVGKYVKYTARSLEEMIGSLFNLKSSNGTLNPES